MFSKVYFEKTAERAAKSFTQGFLGFWLVSPVAAITFEALFTQANLKAGVVMAVLSVATSILGKNVGPEDSPSLV